MERQIYKIILNFLLKGGDEELKKMLKEANVDIFKAQVYIKKIVFTCISKKLGLKALREQLRENNVFLNLLKTTGRSRLNYLYDDKSAYFNIKCSDISIILQNCKFYLSKTQEVKELIANEYIPNKDVKILNKTSREYNISRRKIRDIYKTVTITQETETETENASELWAKSKQLVKDYENYFYTGKKPSQETIKAYKLLQKQIPQ